MHINVYFLNLFMYMHGVTSYYILIYSQNSEKIQLNFNWIFNFAPRVTFNF